MKSTERAARVGETKREQGSYFFLKKKKEKNDVGGFK
jgi:hypothetical protein